MNNKVVRAGLTAASTAGFLLLGSCSLFQSNAPRDDIFNSRGGNMPPPTSSAGRGIPAAPTTAPVQGTSLLLNPPSGDVGTSIVIDEKGPIENPPIQTYSAPKVSTMTYKVKRNDSLWKVANSHGVTVSELARVNNLSKTSGLKIGQKLSLPIGARYKPNTYKSSKPGSSSVSGKSLNYTVKKGDSLSVIAWRYQTNVSAIKSANSLKSNSIRIGQKLKIPGGAKPRSGSGRSSSGSSSLPPVSGNVYTVKKGDSLSVIAQRYGTSTKALKQANGLKGNNIIVGKKLVIPSSAKRQPGEPSATQRSIKDSLTTEPELTEPPVEDEPEKPVTNPFDDPEVKSDPEVTTEPVEDPAPVAEDPLKNMKLMDVLVVESDTLESLSGDFNTTKELILKANPDVQGNEDLKPGMVIKVPRAQ